MDNTLRNLTNLPPIVIDHDELLSIPKHRRVGYVLRKYLSGSNVLEKAKVVRYFTEAIIDILEGFSNPVLNRYLGVFKNGISLFELNTIFTNLIKVEEEDREYLSKKDTLQTVIKENFFKTDNIYIWDNSSDQVKLIIQNISKTPPEIAERYKLKILVKEEVNDIYSEEAIIVAELDGLPFAIHYDITDYISGYSSKNKEQFEFYVPWENNEDNSEPYSRCVKIISVLSKMAIEVFCHRIKPSINYVTIDKNGHQIHTKKEVDEKIRNIDYDDLKSSMRYCLDNNKKRGIAIVGDPGLGKTLLIHKLINDFKDVPTFIVRNEALLDVESIRRVFNLVREMKAILVFDDFDGLDVQEKGPITNEFLHQMDVNGEFRGIIIATVNDPSKVHYTLIARPERFDEVLLMRYPSSKEEIEEICLNKLTHIGEEAYMDQEKDEAYHKFINIAIDNKFSHARISSSIDYCMSHFHEITGEKLYQSSLIMLDFQKTAKMFSANGELMETSEKYAAPLVERKKSLATMGDTNKFEVMDDDWEMTSKTPIGWECENISQ